MLNTAAEVRAYMKEVNREQAAFACADGGHVLVQIDRQHGIGLIDPAGHVAWRRLHRTDRWPLVPLDVVPQSDDQDPDPSCVGVYGPDMLPCERHWLHTGGCGPEPVDSGSA